MGHPTLFSDAGTQEAVDSLAEGHMPQGPPQRNWRHGLNPLWRFHLSETPALSPKLHKACDHGLISRGTSLRLAS